MLTVLVVISSLQLLGIGAILFEVMTLNSNSESEIKCLNLTNEWLRDMDGNLHELVLVQKMGLEDESK